jgi:hypothetical protein
VLKKALSAGATHRRKGWLVGLACCLCLLEAAFADEMDQTIAASCPGITAWLREKAARKDAAPAPAGIDADLRARLLRMVAEDQTARKAAFRTRGSAADPIAVNHMMVVDRRNLAALDGIVAAGIPTPQRVGREGMDAFWLLVQHAVNDVALQERVLRAFEAADSGIASDEIAMLTDRVRVARGRPQLYGSQFKTSGGALEPYPIEDEAHVEDRRKAVGLPPLADYVCELRAVYRIAPRK